MINLTKGYCIDELDKEIKTRKTKARKMLNLEQKVKKERNIKDLEKKPAEEGNSQYQNEDDIEQKKMPDWIRSEKG